MTLLYLNFYPTLLKPTHVHYKLNDEYSTTDLHGTPEVIQIWENAQRWQSTMSTRCSFLPLEHYHHHHHCNPKGLRTEAVTGRRCPHSGAGEDFWVHQPFFFYQNRRNSETKSRTIEMAKIRPHTGKQKLFRVTSGYWVLIMIPLNRIRPSQNIGVS